MKKSITVNRISMVSRATVSLIIIFLLSIFDCKSNAAPIIPITFTIEGEIKEVVWRPQRLMHKGMPGMSGSLGHDSYSPAQYQTVIINFIIEADDKISRSEVEKLKKTNELTLFLPHEKDDGFLKKGMNIKVIKYCIRGDEGGNWYRHEKIIILSPNTDLQLPPDTSVQGSQNMAEINTYQSLLAPEEELITLLFGSINNRQNQNAVKLLSQNINPNKETEQLWIKQFNVIRSVHIMDMKETSKETWTDTQKIYQVTLEIYMDNSAANAPIPNNGWTDNPNIRFIRVVKINNRWFIDQIGTGP
jgi:hypothetical protein